MRTPGRKDRVFCQQGGALLFALGVTAILAVLAFRLLADRATSQDIEAAVIRQLDYEAAAFSAQALFEAALLAGEKNVGTTLHDDWAQLDGKSLPLTASGRTFQLAARDLSGLFPINFLLDADGRESPAHVQAFQRLLLLVDRNMDRERARALTDALLDWLDLDLSPRPHGAESDYYLSLASPYPSANQPLEQLAELERIKGFTKKLLYGKEGTAGLMAYCSSKSRDGRINLNTAPHTVLAALIADDGRFSLAMTNFRALAPNHHLLADPLWYQKVPGYNGSLHIPAPLTKVTGDFFSLCLQETTGEKRRISCTVFGRAGDGAVTMHENVLY